jgi:hypothetical protein
VDVGEREEVNRERGGCEGKNEEEEHDGGDNVV